MRAFWEQNTEEAGAHGANVVASWEATWSGKAQKQLLQVGTVLLMSPAHRGGHRVLPFRAVKSCLLQECMASNWGPLAMTAVPFLACASPMAPSESAAIPTGVGWGALPSTRPVLAYQAVSRLQEACYPPLCPGPLGQVIWGRPWEGQRAGLQLVAGGVQWGLMLFHDHSRSTRNEADKSCSGTWATVLECDNLFGG